MTDFKASDRDVNRAIRSWLQEDRHEDASRIAEAVLDQASATPRRRAGWPAWRTPIMNRIVTFGLAAAVVVIGLFLGYRLLGEPTNVGGPSEPTATPEPTPVATPEPSPSATTIGLEPGSQWDLAALSTEIGGAFITVPGPGWDGDGDAGLIFSVTEDDTGILEFDGDLWIYGDPCAWSSTTPDAPATTVDEIIDALASQASRDASAPEDITIGAYAGQRITLHVPDDIAFDPATDAGFPDCEQTYFGTLHAAALDEPPPHRYQQGPGQIDEFWVVDVDGVPVVLDLTYWPDTPQDVVDDLHAMAESLSFELP
jgi:hypothetical protein